MHTEKSSHDQNKPQLKAPRADLLLCLVLALVAGVGAWHLAGRVPVAVLDGGNPDIYFSSDASRVHQNMYSRHTNHWRTVVHPIFSLELHPAYLAMAVVTGADLSGGALSLDAVAVAHRMSGLAAGIATVLLFALLRLAGLRRFDSVLFCVLASVSAFAIFWFSIPETYPWGSASILAALVLAALGSSRKLSAAWYVAASILTLSYTTTNWMVGLVVTWTRFNILKTIQWSAVAFAATLALAVAQKLIFPSSWLFIRPGGEKSYVMQQQSGGPIRCLTSILSHTIIMPTVTTAPHSKAEGKTVLRTQYSAPGSASGWGKAAVVCWALLLVAGLYALVTLPGLVPLRLTLGLALLGQIGLHTIYGAETFLYAAHYGPMMIAIAALAMLTRLRPYVLGTAALLVVCLVMNNFPVFQHTLELVKQYTVKP